MNLKKLREEKNVTQEQLREATGIPQTTLSCYDRGVFKPKYTNAKTLANFFGITIEELHKDELKSEK